MNLALLLGSMSLASLAIAVIAVVAGIPTGGRSIAEIVLGGLLAPLFLLAGPGFLVALLLIAVIGYGGRRGLGRWFAVGAAAVAGFTWLGIFLSPQLLSNPPLLPSPAVLVAVVPWLAYGLAARLPAGSGRVTFADAD